MAHPVSIQQRNQDATVYVGDLDQSVNEEVLWELMLQAGPVVNVHIPRDKLLGTHSGFGFVEFRTEEDADYAIKIMNMIRLYGRPIKVNKASQSNRNLDVGANLFIGNLDPEVDEKLLYDTFSAFGFIISTPKIMRQTDQGGQSKGFGFISYDNFESSDAAIAAMNGQYLCGRPITVSYALKKDSKTERHGSGAERLLASAQTQSGLRPHTMFAAAPTPQQIPMYGIPPVPGVIPTGVPPPQPMSVPPTFISPGAVPGAPPNQVYYQ
jgi:splicing factor 3B subunit 4